MDILNNCGGLPYLLEVPAVYRNLDLHEVNGGGTRVRRCHEGSHLEDSVWGVNFDK